ncbi:MAG TPA: TonB family protein [Terriglobales bacterium]|jgi:protein TonB|nr:TonB family protein [Terriglobales bacterium]
MPLPEENELPELNPAFGDESEQKQRRQMLIALALLLLALILVLVKDRDFWFPPEPAAQSESEPVEQTPSDTQTPPAAAPATAKSLTPTHLKTKAHAAPPPVAESPAPALAPVVTSRAVLPPLEVEVVAGDEHRTIRAGTNSVKVELQPRTPVVPTPSDSGGVADATARVHLSPGMAEIVSRPVEPNYPLLAKQMKVQGAVVLEALIGRDGNIQDLHILSGPAILSAAAREAVKQWRFKPYLQSGEAVETEARITVNFTISTQ